MSGIRVISSMATRQLLADLVARWQGPSPVDVESVGGVEAARRVRTGEAFDAVVLAAGAIDELTEAGLLVADSRVDLVRSAVCVAVRSGTAHPDLSSGQAVRAAVLAARTVGYSTGPSGVALQKQFAQWGIADEVKEKLVQAPPGVPVGSLLARGEVELGFQQLSELMSVQGIDVVGPLPPAIQVTTTFSAGVTRRAADVAQARALLRFMTSPGLADIKRANGMEPA